MYEQQSECTFNYAIGNISKQSCQDTAIYRVRLYEQYFLTRPPNSTINHFNCKDLSAEQNKQQSNRLQGYAPSARVVRHMVICHGMRPSPSDVRMKALVSLACSKQDESVFLYNTLLRCFVVSLPISSIL